MGNKNQLQVNNADLATSLATIQSLPMADDVKHGVYAWGKYVGRTIDTIPYSITETVDMGNPAEFTIYKDIKINNGIATGIDTNTVLIYDMAGGEDITSAEYPYYIYNGIAYVDARISRNALYVQGNKIKTGKGEFVETVVSDISNKYPDKGEKDDYYYEKIYTENATEYGIFYNDVDSDGYPTNVKLVQSDIKDNFFLTSSGYTEMYSKLHKVEIITNAIGNSSFESTFYKVKNPFEMKLKCSSIGRMAFRETGRYDSVRGNIWINKK